jgi:hypothetical protein
MPPLQRVPLTPLQRGVLSSFDLVKTCPLQKAYPLSCKSGMRIAGFKRNRTCVISPGAIVNHDTLIGKLFRAL